MSYVFLSVICLGLGYVLGFTTGYIYVMPELKIFIQKKTKVKVEDLRPRNEKDLAFNPESK